MDKVKKGSNTEAPGLSTNFRCLNTENPEHLSANQFDDAAAFCLAETLKRNGLAPDSPQEQRGERIGTKKTYISLGEWKV